MKSLMILMVCIITSLFSNSKLVAKPKLTVSVNMELGRKKLNCDKIGVCKVSVDVDFDVEKISTITYDDEGFFEIKLPLSEIPNDKLKFLNGKTINFEETFTLPTEVSKMLGFNSVTFDEGSVEVIKYEDSYSLIVRSYTAH